MPAYADTRSTISLSVKEQKWLESHPVIRIGMDADYAPYSFMTADGKYHGVAPDFMNRISDELGVQFEIVPNLTWPQIMKGVKDRSLDTVATAVWTPERDQFLNFTDIYIPTPLVVMARKDDARINTVADIAEMRVALVKGYSSTRKVIREHPSINPLEVDTVLDGLRAVATGQADVYIGVLGVSTFLASKHGITNLKIADSYEMELNGQRIGVRKDWPELITLLEKSLKAIPEIEKIKILNKWAARDTVHQRPSLLELSANEKQWLSNHQEIRLAIDPDFAPVEFIDSQGRYSGISADYVNVLSKKLGIKMRVVPGLSWSEALAKAKKGEIDIFAAMSPTSERRQYLNFTKPYFKYPIVIYTRTEFPLTTGLNSLTKKKITVVKDYFVHETLRQSHPELELIAVNNLHDGLSLVSTGGADAFVGDIATATFTIRKYNLTNLKIAAPAEISSQGHSLAVRKDWPELVTIINKAMDTITPDEHLDISKKWVEIEIEKTHWLWIWIAIIAAGLMLLFIVVSTFLRRQVHLRTSQLSLKNHQLENENIERQRAEKALIDSEQRLSQFFHATYEMVFFHDKGVISDANPATLVMTGYTYDEIIGKNLLDFVADESKQKVYSQMSEEGEESYEVSIVTKSGSTMPVDINATNININGKLARVVSLRDITERKRNEQALQNAHDMLEVKVEERTAELSQANLKLQELDKLKSMFIASVSHELRTPLNSIIGFSSIMMQNAYGILSDKHKDYIKRINNSGLHLLSLITDIIDISKIESGHIDVELSNFDLSDVVEEAIENLQHDADAKGLNIQVNIEEGLNLYTDRKRLFQCVLNFLSNAIKYSEHGLITIRGSNRDDKFILTVRDTGIGISKKEMPRLFETFERIDSHLRVKAGGTGLGLYLTKKIATELLHGEIGAESEPGKGSEFWIMCPKVLQV